MAIVQNFNNNQDNQTQDNSINKPVPMGGAGGGNAAPAGPQGSANTSAAPTVGANGAGGAGTSSGRFTNLSTYLNANKDYNKEGGGLGGQLYGSVQNKANDIQSGYQGAQKDFNTQANAGRTQYDANTVNQAVADPNKFASNADNVNSFTKMRDAAYGGPQGVANADQYANQAADFGSMAKMGGSEGGRFALLNKMYGTPTYSHGQQSFDNLLMQGNQDSMNKLAQMNPLAQNLNDTIQTGNKQATADAAKYGQEAADTQAQTRAALSGAIGNFDTQAGKTAADAQAASDAQYSHLQNALRGNSGMGGDVLTDADKANLGVSGVQNFGANGLDPSGYLQQNNIYATKQNALNADQYAQIGALGKLAGNTMTGPASAQLAAYGDPSQAGSFANQKSYGFDTSRYLQDLANKNRPAPVAPGPPPSTDGNDMYANGNSGSSGS